MYFLNMQPAVVEPRVWFVMKYDLSAYWRYFSLRRTNKSSNIYVDIFSHFVKIGCCSFRIYFLGERHTGVKNESLLFIALLCFCRRGQFIVKSNNSFKKRCRF